MLPPKESLGQSEKDVAYDVRIVKSTLEATGLSTQGESSVANSSNRLSNDARSLALIGHGTQEHRPCTLPLQRPKPIAITNNQGQELEDDSLPSPSSPS